MICRCYEAYLQSDSGLRGTLTMRWTIDLSGKVQRATALANTMNDKAPEGCMLRVLRQLTFDKPKGGVCIVQWPFVFKALDKK